MSAPSARKLIDPFSGYVGPSRRPLHHTCRPVASERSMIRWITATRIPVCGNAPLASTSLTALPVSSSTSPRERSRYVVPEHALGARAPAAIGKDIRLNHQAASWCSLLLAHRLVQSAEQSVQNVLRTERHPMASKTICQGESHATRCSCCSRCRLCRKD